MARIVLGLGTTHGPMLSVPSQYWKDRVPFDRKAEHPFRGQTYTFDEIAAVRKDEDLAAQITPEVCEQRYVRCQNAIHQLGEIYNAVNPDVAVIVGNDQMEVFTSDHVPAFAIFWGPYTEGVPRTPEFLAKLPPGIARAEFDRTPAEYTQYPGSPQLGRHLIESSMAAGFDVAQMTKLPTGQVGSNAAPHAYGFIYRRVMRDRVIPNVPVFVNTFYPPNQPRAGRCYEFGRMLGRAIEAWPDDVTVMLMASGGLSHFVVDEAFDQMVLDAMQREDSDKLAAIPESVLQSGTSELKNWIVTSGVMSEAGLKMSVLDYVPCYRSEAGTGSGMGFTVWR